MQLPIPVTRPVYLLIAAASGGVAFALGGVGLGFYSLWHWIWGALLVGFYLRFYPRIFQVR